MNGFRAKTFANTYIYSKKDENGKTTEQELVNYILKSSQARTRINKNSTAFVPVANMVKERQKTAVLYRMLMNPDVVLAISPTGKELPSSFKVFESVDLASSNKRKRIFIDCTGLISYEDGYFKCKEIDKLCTYLFNAVVIGTYYEDNLKIVNNSQIVKSATWCFTKMFCAVLDQMRVVNYSENRLKIAYIAACYFSYALLQKDVDSCTVVAANAAEIDVKTAKAYNVYFNEEEDFKSIDTFITYLSKMFSLKGLDTGVYINKWLLMYGNGSLYALELLPSFLTVITSAYSGAYVNRQNIIESICGKELVTLSEALLRVGANVFDKGFVYSRDYNREDAFTENMRIEASIEKAKKEREAYEEMTSVDSLEEAPEED